MFNMNEKLSRSLVPQYKMDAITHLCHNASNLVGDVIEIGVWKGGVGMHLSDILPTKTIYLIDTFTGIPYSSEQDNYHKANDFNDASYDDVTELFKPLANVKVMQGIFPDVFLDVFDKHTFSVVHLDVDVYKGYKDGLEFVYPRMVTGGIILLDDYDAWSCEGAKIAVDEFLQNKNEKLQVYNNQYYFIKD